ncbi:DUF4232 domain-containing protein [Streptomyces sp. NPDC007808]|uniref:DUF4232 domain-containing protein n=1 Tax=Streptomyces sp. NPDC007808 TaxID=3364779 RepID=UPI00367C0ED7
MTTTPRTVPAVLAGVLLLAACGSQRPSAQGDAGQARGGGDAPVRAEALCPSEFTRYGGAPPTGEPASRPSPSGTPTPLPLPSLTGPGEHGVEVTGLYAWGPDSGCAAGYSADFEVTNRQREPLTYTVTISFRSATSGAVDNVEQTVESVAPGRTVTGSVAMSQSPGKAFDVSGAQVLKVRSVPADEASTASGPCPASGVHVYADRGDAALGLRVVGLHLVNCGTRPYRLDGYPELELLDEEHDFVDSVRILHGTERISPAAGGEGGPRPVVLRPGEAALAGLAWRNTTGAGEPVNAPYVRVRAKPGAPAVTVVPEFDLGTTGRLGVGPWKKDETYQGAGTATGRPTPPPASAVPSAFPAP